MNVARAGVLDLPESLAWLLRSNDASKTSETFEVEEVQKAKPFFRARIANRDSL